MPKLKKLSRDKILIEIHKKTTMTYDTVEKIYHKTLSYDSIFIIYDISSRYNLDIFEIADSWQLSRKYVVPKLTPQQVKYVKKIMSKGIRKMEVSK